MNDDKWGAEAEKQAKRLRAVMEGKPEKWQSIVSLAKAEMKKSTSARSHRAEIDNDDSENESVFLSGDEIEAEQENEDEGAGAGGHESGGDGKHKEDEVRLDRKLVGEAQTRKKSPRAGCEAMRKGGSSEAEGVSGDDGETVEKLGQAGEATNKGEDAEHDRAGEEVDEVRPPVAPRPKKVRSGKERAKVKVTTTVTTDVRLGSPRDNGGANGVGEEVIPTIRRKRKAVLVESEPEDEEDASLDVGGSTAGSAKRRKIDGVRAAASG